MTTDSTESVPDQPKDPVSGKTVAEILGEIVWLMTQDPAGREMKVADIERLVMPAILQRRFHIRYARVPDARQPNATVLQPIRVEISDVKDKATPGADAPILCFSIPNIHKI